ncbi:LOW QUALITY PROTEIN: hypothetical protein KUTeg_018857 [Tegillarca granosa]|uniref:Uncharacterized protein n=1 Tax=Tegillarca granosa TaxID=220873 RepID=A0ABQ9EDH0_TEGGR|nr:LOW QUALITY PROTEIN: hypothetical protein KUTeg_018857 [Tegillarca granosa]
MQKYVLIVQFLQKGIFANDNILWLFYLYMDLHLEKGYFYYRISWSHLNENFITFHQNDNIHLWPVYIKHRHNIDEVFGLKKYNKKKKENERGKNTSVKKFPSYVIIVNKSFLLQCKIHILEILCFQQKNEIKFLHFTSFFFGFHINMFRNIAHIYFGKTIIMLYMRQVNNILCFVNFEFHLLFNIKHICFLIRISGSYAILKCCISNSLSLVYMFLKRISKAPFLVMHFTISGLTLKTNNKTRKIIDSYLSRE